MVLFVFKTRFAFAQVRRTKNLSRSPSVKSRKHFVPTRGNMGNCHDLYAWGHRTCHQSSIRCNRGSRLTVRMFALVRGLQEFYPVRANSKTIRDHAADNICGKDAEIGIVRFRFCGMYTPRSSSHHHPFPRSLARCRPHRPLPLRLDQRHNLAAPTSRQTTVATKKHASTFDKPSNPCGICFSHNSVFLFIFW